MTVISSSIITTNEAYSGTAPNVGQAERADVLRASDVKLIVAQCLCYGSSG